MGEQDLETKQAEAWKQLPALRKDATVASGLTALSVANAGDLAGVMGVSSDGKKKNILVNEPKGAKTGPDITSVTMMAEGKERHFVRIHTSDPNSPSGLQASAWMEVKDPKTKEPLLQDGKKNIIIAEQGFAGAASDLLAMKPPARNEPTTRGQRQARELFNVGDGKLTSQTLEVDAFLNETLEKAGTDGKDVSLTVSGHSMGSSAALATQAFAAARGIESRTMLFDPVSGTTGVNRIREALAPDDSKLSTEQKGLREQLIEASRGKKPHEILAQFDAAVGKDVTSFASRSWQKGWDTHASRSGSMRTGENERDNNFDINLSGKVGGKDATIASKLTDEGNRPPGRTYYVDETTRKVQGYFELDPSHKIVNIYAGMAEGRLVVPAEMYIPLGQNAYKAAADMGKKNAAPLTVDPTMEAAVKLGVGAARALVSANPLIVVAQMGYDHMAAPKDTKAQGTNTTHKER